VEEPKKPVYTLKVEIIESKQMKPGSVIDIQSGNLIGSLRNVKDGYSYFGTEKDNDYVVPNAEKGFGKKHFSINYEEPGKFFLKDYGEGTGTFIKIQPKLILKNNQVVSFGNFHFAVFFPPDVKNETILMKFLDGYRPKEIRNFKRENSPITIGRLEESIVHVPLEGISRNQCK